MKICQCCGALASAEAPHCARCGEASWKAAPARVAPPVVASDPVAWRGDPVIVGGAVIPGPAAQGIVAESTADVVAAFSAPPAPIPPVIAAHKPPRNKHHR